MGHDSWPTTGPVQWTYSADGFRMKGGDRVCVVCRYVDGGEPCVVVRIIDVAYEKKVSFTSRLPTGYGGSRIADRVFVSPSAAVKEL